MNKKLFVSIIAVVALVAIFATLFVGCNPFKWEAVGGGEPNADVESNGGYFVKQGKYVYFINGYDTAEVIDNTFGTPVKNGIVRVEIDKDGKYTNPVVVVPKQISNGGFAIFGDWIYYATPNNDPDKNGIASTTHTDLMRTKIDGSATQLIETINSRTSAYLFTKTRILFKEPNGTAVYYIDFSGMKNEGSSTSQAGVTTGTLLENVETLVWDMNSEYIYFTEAETGDTSYEALNTLNSIKVDGTDKKVLADKLTYLAEGEKENYKEYFHNKVFKYALVKMMVESDGIALYYSKSNKVSGQDVVAGLYVNKLTAGGSFDATKEKCLTNNKSFSSTYPLGYAEGALVTISSNVFHVNSVDGAAVNDKVIGRATTVQTVVDGVVYYTDSTGGKVYSIKLDRTGNEKVVAELKFNASVMSLEFAKLNIAGADQLVLAFFDSNDYNYVHVANLLSADVVKESQMIGIINDADKEAIEKAEKGETVTNAE